MQYDELFSPNMTMVDWMLAWSREYRWSEGLQNQRHLTSIGDQMGLPLTSNDSFEYVACVPMSHYTVMFA